MKQHKKLQLAHRILCCVYFVLVIISGLNALEISIRYGWSCFALYSVSLFHIISSSLLVFGEPGESVGFITHENSPIFFLLPFVVAVVFAVLLICLLAKKPWAGKILLTILALDTLYLIAQVLWLNDLLGLNAWFEANNMAFYTGLSFAAKLLGLLLLGSYVFFDEKSKGGSKCKTTGD